VGSSPATHGDGSPGNRSRSDRRVVLAPAGSAAELERALFAPAGPPSELGSPGAILEGIEAATVRLVLTPKPGLRRRATSDRDALPPHMLRIDGDGIHDATLGHEATHER
jgi:hypothetical protein